MKRVLLVTWHFPPHQGPGIVRPLAFTRHLPAFGWEPLVLAALPPGEISPPPPSAAVTWVPCPRADNHRPRSLARFLYRLADPLLAPDDQALWTWPAIPTGVRLVRDYDINAVLATGPPFTSLLVGEAVARKTGRPLAVDFRDDWTGFDPHFRSGGTLRRWRSQAMEKRVVGNSGLVITVTEALAADLCRRHPDAAPRVNLLPNGYDPDDFTGEARHPSPGKLALVHAGSLYARRSPRTFLEGLERFCRINPEAAGKLRVFFWGTLDREVDELLAGWKAGGMVEAGTILPRPACLAGIRGADLLLLVVDDVPVADRIMTGKIFEYLAAGKPILAISDPHSPAAELVVRTRSGIVVPHGRPDQVAACLELVVAAWEEKRLALDQDRGLVAQYSRVEQSRQLARLLDGLVGESGAAH